MMLRQRKGCYDPKDLEGFLPVLDRSLYDGGTLLFLVKNQHPTAVELTWFIFTAEA